MHYHSIDTSANTHPLSPTDNYPFYFDDITYNKGAAILHQLMTALLGKDTFQKTLQQYLNQYAFRSASTADFFKVVESNLSPSKHDQLHKFWNSWVLGQGYPLVSTYWNEDDRSLTLLQESASASITSQPYFVPVEARFFYFDPRNSSRILFNSTATFLLTESSQTFILSDHAGLEFRIFLNANMNCFYRPAYTVDQSIMLSSSILPLLTPLERAGYLDNLVEVLISRKSNQTFTGSTQYLSQALKFIEHEADPSVWQMFFSAISRFEEAVRSTSEHSSLLFWMQKLLDPILVETPCSLVPIQGLLFEFALGFKSKRAVLKSIELYPTIDKHPDLASFILTGVVRFHGKFEEVLTFAMNSSMPINFVAFLASSNNQTEQSRLLSLFRGSKKALSIIAEQYSHLGKWKEGWELWASCSRMSTPLKIDLEKLVRQINEQYYIEQAKAASVFSNSIRRGLERGKVMKAFQQS